MAARAYTATVEIDTPEPVTEGLLADAAAIGGAARGNPGGRRLGFTFTVGAIDIPAAVRKAAKSAAQLAGDTAELVAVEITTVAEADRRLAEPAFPDLVGIAEVAEMLNVSRQRASALQTHRDFPAPVASLRSGPVWRRGDLSRFVDGWTRLPGRRRVK